VDTELRVPIAAMGTAEFSTLIEAGVEGGITVPLDRTTLSLASTGLASYRLANGSGERWLAAHVPHEHPPVGFRAAADGKVVRLENLRLDASGRRQRSRTVRAARRCRSIDCSGDSIDPVVAARWIIELAGAGAVPMARVVPVRVASLLGPELSALVEAGASPALDDDVIRERHSVLLRRSVHRHHSVYEALGAVAASVGHTVPTWPSVSILLSTNRADMLVLALEQIASQDYPDVEVLCGLHGIEPPPGLGDVVAGLGIDVHVETCGTDLDLGQVLAFLGRRATGTLITKWDDDDWYSVDHLRDLVAGLRYSGADLVGKAAEYVRLEGLDLTVRRFSGGSESYSTTIAGGTLMLRRRLLEELGGWPAGARRVDRLLIEAVEAAGGSVYRIHGDGYLLRRAVSAESHTWQVDEGYFLDQSSEQRPGCDLRFAGIRR
jgi:hypothetical protein